ncbi:glycosyl hydrolase 53 family protein [Mucilaginibacter sp. OK283]|uniref:glycoside hydrolase family 53 protein n=1 Tax=Mucilaginibacter sp. OK283 TaxID=1881049 RepID=UPI0008D39076|nr:glycosyl hydrolase 53 family protein [Mucilaginibacter sp. OK283]SEP15513.1 arabinogalactan endo-1,4-beta-galactosidase [Mucilaginibacter sp. OK283]
MKKALCSCLLLISCLNFSCSKTKSTPEPVVVDPPVVIAKGADISWVTEMEAKGIKFYDKSGTQQDLFALLKSLGFNAIRLRAWVNPTNGYCNTADVVAKALRAKAQGFNIMIDFHYSDWWADPGKQTKPAAWAALDFTTLTSTLHDYTKSVMNTLKDNGITPAWVQVGNETNDGMLWEDGRASKNMANFATLVKSGYAAVKEVSPTTQVIVHISNGYDNGLFRWMFDGLKANGAKWDIIGMSLYSSKTNWATLDSQCLTNMNDMVSRYSTPVMVVEVGIEAGAPAEAKAFLSDIISKVKSVNGSSGKGVFYWEPEAYNNWQGYGLGAFDTAGKPTAALDAFAN